MSAGRSASDTIKSAGYLESTVYRTCFAKRHRAYVQRSVTGSEAIASVALVFWQG